MEARSPQEQQLVAGCLAGRARSQRKVFDLYAKAMLNTAFRILGEEEEARDALQEAFVKVFQKMNQFKGESSLGAWIKRIVVNTALNKLRKKGLDLVDLESTGLEPVAPAASVPAELPPGLAQRAIAQLPPGYRAVCSLYLLEGYDHQEIAEILGISLSTSLSQFSRGKKRLRSIITTLLSHEFPGTILQR